MFSDLTGTPFQETHLPLTVWFHAADLLLSAGRLRTGNLARSLGVDRKTALRIKNRLWPLREDPFIHSIAVSILCQKI
jgi:hypothetical protein